MKANQHNELKMQANEEIVILKKKLSIAEIKNVELKRMLQKNEKGLGRTRKGCLLFLLSLIVIWFICN